jgi:hypothetical protein
VKHLLDFGLKSEIWILKFTDNRHRKTKKAIPFRLEIKRLFNRLLAKAMPFALHKNDYFNFTFPTTNSPNALPCVTPLSIAGR